MIRKILCMLLALVLPFSVLAGCADNNASVPTNGAPSANEAAGTSGFQESEAPPVAGNGDESIYPMVGDPVTLTSWTPFNPHNPTVITDIYDLDSIAYVEGITGVHIDYVLATGAVREQLGVLIASGDYTDILQYVNKFYGIYEAIQDDIIIDISPYLEEYAPNYYSYIESDPDIRRDVLCDNEGTIGAFYNIQEENIPMFGHLIRQDWLDELGLDIPVTYDDYYNVLTAFKSEYGLDYAYLLDQNGQNSSIISGFGVNGFIIDGAASYHGYLYQVDDRVKISLLEEGYREYLAEMSKWYNEGIISSDFVSLTPNQMSDDQIQKIVTGEVGIFHHLRTFISTFETMSEEPSFNLTGISNPVKKAGDETHFRSTAMVSNNVSAMTVTTVCENVELAVQWCDFWYSSQGSDIWNYGIEGQSFTRNAQGKVELTDLVINNEWDASPENALMNYCLYNLTLASYVPSERQLFFFTEEDMDTYYNWMAGDGDYLLPVLSITGNDSNEYNRLAADLETFTSEMVVKFITGELSVETDWEEFTAQIKSLGAETMVAMYQEAYDQYLLR